MKVTIFRDYPEQGWESMEVYADNLVKNLTNLRKNKLAIKQFVGLKNWSKYFSREKKTIRYFFRYVVNPPLSFFQQGQVNHIIDQSNAHLLCFLDPKKTVVTCHDLIVPFWLSKHRVKTNFKKKIKDKGGEWRMNQLKKAAKIITVSQATKNELIGQLAIDPNNIVVVPEGKEDFFKKIDDKKILNKFIHKHQLPDKYLLHVGSNEDYKNIEQVLGVFSALSRQYKDLYLVKVGQFWHPNHLRLIKKLKIKDRIRFLGYLPREELPLIYNLAKGLMQLSYTEGFGLTVVEAMACGCPVIVSDIPALKEIASRSGIYVDINHKSTIAEPIIQLIHSKSMYYKYSRLGIQRARFFTWEKTAKKTYQVYQSVLTK